MKHLISAVTVSLVLIVCCTSSPAQNTREKTWDQTFFENLTKIRSPQKTDGLGFTLTEEEALQEAIKTAMNQEAPACEALKMAVDMNFNPYSVLTGIFSSGAKVDLEQLCLCATETGDLEIPKSLMAQAANSAVDANTLTRDEVAQAQCIQQGLGFTEAPAVFALVDPGGEDPNPYSR